MGNQNSIRSIGIFCGANSGFDPVFAEAAFQCGQFLAKRGITIVYGGGKVGMMGQLADGALSEGGKVIGVIPDFLKAKELQHLGITELITVDSMHSRKFRIHEISDAFLALPGGFGTMDEIFEMTTWGQLGLHTRPVGFLNVAGYFEELGQQMDKMTRLGFLKHEHRKVIYSSPSIISILESFQNHKAPDTGKWITKEQI